MRVALYARVSTDDKGQNPETQLLPLRDEVTRRGWTIAEEYVDRGWSGAHKKRPALDRLMTDLDRERFDTVLVWRFDRFARSTVHLIKALETFQARGIGFVSLTESIDTSSPMGKFIYTVFAALAELERSIIRERVRAGMERARREGKTLGRPTVLVDRQIIFERAQRGDSISAIARDCGCSRPKIRAILKGGNKAPKLHGEKPVNDSPVSVDNRESETDSPPLN